MPATAQARGIQGRQCDSFILATAFMVGTYVVSKADNMTHGYHILATAFMVGTWYPRQTM